MDKKCTMRREDRKVDDRADIESFLSAAKVVRIAFNDDGHPYIVPLSFGYEWTGELPLFYFHSALAGHKVGLMDAAPDVCFELDELRALTGGDLGCSWTARYFSVIGHGRLERVDGCEEKMKALHLILRQQCGRDFPVPEASLDSVLVMRLQAASMSAKCSKG